MFPLEPPSAIVRLLKPSQQRIHDERALKTISLLGKIFTPGVPINRPSEFSGRKELLKTIQEKFATTGQTLVFYGNRGLGKTSLALVAFHKRRIVRHTCSKGSTFQSVFLDVLTKLNAQFSTVERGFKQGDSLELGLKDVGKMGWKDEMSEKESAVAKQKLDPNFVMARLTPWQSELKAIVIDEFQEVSEAEDQQAFLDTAKILSDHRVDIPVVLVGHAGSDMDLFKVSAYRDYRGRYISAIEVKEMPDSELADIIQRRQKTHGTNFTPQALAAIVRIAAGYPTLVHRLALASSIERANKQTNVEVGWRAVFGRYGQGNSFLDDPTWIVTQADVYGAVLRFVQEERDTHQGVFVDLIESFAAATPRPALEVPRPASGSILASVLRGAGYVAKYHLETKSTLKPSCLVESNMEASKEMAILQSWSRCFYPEDLNLEQEKMLLPRVVSTTWSRAENWQYEGERAPAVLVRNVALSQGDPQTEKPRWFAGSLVEKLKNEKTTDEKDEPPSRPPSRE